MVETSTAGEYLVVCTSINKMRYDYEAVSSDGANQMMSHLRQRISELKKGDKFGDFDIPLEFADEFEYKDPVDGSVSSRQGLRFVFKDGSRVIIRLSGTGSVGATIRLYLEQYEPNVANHDKETLVSLFRLRI